jgi:DNA-binding LacI/PurR family transcriptional regulator
MKVTLKDISDSTGFSLSTISRAIRGKGRISEKNRKKILSTASKLGYPLPEYNGSLDEKPPRIALITYFRTGEFYASLFLGFSHAAQKKGILISLFDVQPEVKAIQSLIKELKGLGYSAAILFIPELGQPHYQDILRTTPEDFPLISCSHIDDSVLDTVTFDAYQGAAMVAKHFYSQGFRKLGIIEGPYETPEARFRTNGFSDYVKRVSDVDVVWDFKGDYTHESGIRAYDDFEKCSDKPQAIFAANDAMALGFIESLRKKDYRVPDDIAIAGYDNLPFCEYHYPKITSVNTDYSLLAENTIDNLLSRLGQPDKHQGIVSFVPVTLEIRESSLQLYATERALSS